MFIEAIDKLRCLKDHEDSWLVAKFVVMRDRDFWSGELGCPVCEARYFVREGIVYFSEQVVRPARIDPPSSDETFQLAAMLDLSSPGRSIVLTGRWTRFAETLAEMSEPYIFLLNAPAPSSGAPSIYPLESVEAIPLGQASVDAIAIGGEPSHAMMQSALKVLRDSGRLIADARVPVPAGVSLLARDEEKWVAEKGVGLIPLRRANR